MINIEALHNERNDLLDRLNKIEKRLCTPEPILPTPELLEAFVKDYEARFSTVIAGMRIDARRAVGRIDKDRDGNIYRYNFAITALMAFAAARDTQLRGIRTQSVRVEADKVVRCYVLRVA